MSRRQQPFEYHLLVLVTLALVAFGLVMVYSASSARALLASGDAAYYLKRQALYALVGLAGLVVLSRVDFRRVRDLANPLVGASLVLLVAVLALAAPVNGARRWLAYGPVTVQPSELAKLALVLWVAALLARRRPPRTLGELARPLGLVVGIVCLLVIVQPDLGTTIAIVVMVAAMLVVAGTPIRLLASAGAVVTLVALVAIWLEPYRRARIFSFLDPWSDPQGTGFQTVQALLALGSGGAFGNGLGEAVSKINYLPEATTDMILAVVGEELGLVGVSAVVLAFVVFGYAGFNVALRCRDPFGKLLAVGITGLVCGQAALNVCAVLGVAPLTGIPLPFVSYGGSSLVVLLASVGILLNIAVNHAVAPAAAASVPDRRRRDGRSRAAGARGGRGPDRTRRPRHVRGLA